MTTTVRIQNAGHSLHPVRTKIPVSRDEVIQVVENLKNVSVSSFIKSGETVFTYHSKAGEEIPVIATAGR